MRGSGASDQRPVGGLIPIKSVGISRSAVLLNAGTSRAQKTYKSPENAKNNTVRACKVTKHVKLALFAQLCYIDLGRKGRDHPTYEILIQKPFSQGAGDQRTNLVFSGISAPFRRAGTALMLGTTIALTALPANAQDASIQRVAATVDSGVVQATPVAIQTPSIQILDDAQGPADAWVAGSDRIAISVRLGTENRDKMITDLPVAMDYQFALRGKTGIEYFWEEGTSRATGFVMHSDAYVAGPLTFADPSIVVAEIEKVVRLSDTNANDYAQAAGLNYD